MEIGSNGTALMFNNESIADADAAARAMSIFFRVRLWQQQFKGVVWRMGGGREHDGNAVV